MKKSQKVIITCAVTGSIHTPTLSPHLPITPDEIATAAIDAVHAGAAIVHLHARDPITGKPSPDPELFMQFLPRISDATDAICNITTGGAPGFSMDDRLAAPRRAQPELTSLNMGSINFGVFDLARRQQNWKHDWEQPFLESSHRGFQSNTFAQIEQIIADLHHGCGTRFEYECYDVGHLYTLAYYADKKLLEPPFFIQCIFGVLGGIGTDIDHLTHMKSTADRLFGEDYLLSCFAIGRQQMHFLTTCAVMGGNVRVGLEDSLYIGKGELAVSNAQQVTKIRHVVEELGLQIATPTETRALLKLKGRDAVAF